MRNYRIDPIATRGLTRIVRTYLIALCDAATYYICMHALLLCYNYGTARFKLQERTRL